jgi:hypothetical protein
VRRLAAGRPFFLAWSLALLLAGCATPAQYQEPLAHFVEGAQTTRKAVRPLFADYEKHRRDVRVEQAVLARQPLAPILAIPELPPEAVQVRLDILDAIVAYGERLAAVAGSDIETRFEKQTGALAKSVAALGSSIGAAGGTTKSDLEKYAEPVGKLVASLGKLYLEEKRSEILAVAVREGDPSVRRLLDLLEEDLEGMHGQRALRLKQHYAELSATYNKRIAEGGDLFPDAKLLERRKEAAKVRQAYEAWEAFTAANPAEAIRGLRRAHTALVEFAKSDRNPQNATQLAASMRAFAGHAKEFAEAVAAVRKAAKE